MFRRKKAEDEAMLEGPDSTDAVDAGDEAVPHAGDEAAPDSDVEDYLDDDNDYWEAPPRDPLVGWMTLLSVMLVLVVAVATVSIVFFLLGMRGAPRTAVERLIIESEAAVAASPTDEALADLGYAYLSAGRFREAKSTSARGRKVKDSSMFDLLEGDILRYEENHERAVKMYEKGRERNLKELEQTRDEQEARGIFAPIATTTYVSIMIGKGESLVALERSEEALVAFQEAVKGDNTNAFALVRLGDMSAELGKTQEAKEAYEEALRFIPDYEPALTGLANVDDGLKE